MDKITRKWENKEQTFEVLTLEEAKQRGLGLKEWNKADVGDWVATDDGYACQLLRKALYTRPKSGKIEAKTIYWFPFTRIWGNQKLIWGARRHIKDWYNNPFKRWDEIEAGKSRTKRTVQLYVRQVLAGKVDYDQLGRVFRPEGPNFEASAKRLLKQKAVKALIDAELERVLKDKGITKEYVFDVLKKAVEVAQLKNNAAALVSAAHELADLLNMRPKSFAMKEIRELAVSKDIADDMEKALKEFEGRETTAIETRELDSSEAA